MRTMEDVKLILLFLFMFVSSMVPLGQANISDFDEHWQNRKAQAKKAAANAYHPHPHNVTNHVNHHVHNALRRGLSGTQYEGPCMATNPIDQCWRCNDNWAEDRQKLTNCVIGFGGKTTGGKGGEFYVVTDPSDDDMVNPKPGTLRYGVLQKEPLWIIFKEPMTIKLKQELIMASDKTIDGRGFHIHIAGGAGLMLQFVENIIIHSLHIHDIKVENGGIIRDSLDHFGKRSSSDGDGISIFGSTNIWIDHVSMSNCADGLIDAVAGSTAITISNCHFTDHNDVMLLGASDQTSGDQVMQVTVAFNHFGKRLIQRMPRCRWGYFHVVNNDYTHWEMYAIGGSQHPTIICQGNRFVAPPNPNAKEVTKRDAPESVWKNWLWITDGDIFINGAFFKESGDQHAQLQHKESMIQPKPGSAVRELTRFAGALNCKVGSGC